jgi:cholest-4-en-3-one 26-monooxygenase
MPDALSRPDLAPYMASGDDDVLAPLAWLRQNEPVSWQPSLGFWAVTRHDDVIAVERDPALFSSETPLPSVFGEIIINMDPPRHTRLRGLINRGFTPRMIRGIQTRVRQLATEVIDEVVERGECDFVVDVASKIPLAVFGEMLGVPVEDYERVQGWADALSEPEPSEEAPVPGRVTTHTEGQLAAAADMSEYVMGPLREAKRGSTHDDLVSVLLEALDTEQLTEAEFFGFFPLLIVAGNETTRHALAGGLLELIRQPDQLTALRADPSLIPGAVEEVLRWTSPVGFFPRFPTAQAELGGRTIQPGEPVMLFYPSANRDESVFKDPDTFDVRRDPNPQVAFGFGAHYCLGASLARLELRVALEEWLHRVGAVELAGDPTYVRSLFLRGAKHLPITLTAA